MAFPTGRAHVSFSEIKEYVECPHKHWLKHVKKVNLFEPTVHTEFGTAMHAACEDYLITGEMNPQIALDLIDASWEKYGLPTTVQTYDSSNKKFVDSPTGDTYDKASVTPPNVCLLKTTRPRAS